MNAPNQRDALVGLINEICEKIMGHPDARMENAGILRIQAQTNLGIRTLRRLFGLEKASSDYIPQLGTRDILARFCGFENWADWVHHFVSRNDLAIPNDPAAPLPIDIGYPHKPFRNLNWFRREDAKVFFGRNQEITEFIDYLRQPARDQWILFYGQSGVGKSSFLNAGILPRLEQGFHISYYRNENGGGLLGSLDRLEDKGKNRPVFLVVDQVEGIFGEGLSVGLKVLDEFVLKVEKGSGIAKEDLTVLLSFRKENFAEIDAYFQQKELGYWRYYLHPLNAVGIKNAIIGVSQSPGAQKKYQLTMEDDARDAIQAIVAADSESHIAPTLQIILSRLWEEATQDGKWPPQINMDLVDSHIKVRSRFLGGYLDQVIELVEGEESEWVRSGLVLSVLEYFVSDLGTGLKRSKEEVEDNFSQIPEIYDLCRILQDGHLLTEPHSGQGDALRLSHDALGPLILSRFNRSSLPGQIAYRLLLGRFLAYSMEANTSVTPLFTASDLELVESGVKGMRCWTEKEAEVIEKSRNKVNREKRAAKVQRYTIRGTLIGIGLLLGLVIWTGNQTQRAQESRSFALLQEAKAQMDPESGDLSLAREYFEKVVDLGFHEDSVFNELATFSQECIYKFRYSKLELFFSVMDQMDSDDPRRQLFFGEAAFFAFLAKDYEMLVEAEQLGLNGWVPPPELAEIDTNNRWKIAQRIQAGFGEDQWWDWEKKYLPEMVPVPPPLADKEYPPGVKEAITDTFYISKTEVTVGQRLVFLNTSPFKYKYYHEVDTDDLWEYLPFVLPNGYFYVKGYTAKNTFNLLSDEDLVKSQQFPAKMGNLNIHQYTKWTLCRLLSIAEWEYAARGGPRNDTFRFSGGNDLSLYANYRSFSRAGKIGPVASKLPNALGIFDMTGNLAEFVKEDTIYIDYLNLPDTSHILKGGSFATFYESGALDISFSGLARDFGGSGAFGIRLFGEEQTHFERIHRETLEKGIVNKSPNLDIEIR